MIFLILKGIWKVDLHGKVGERAYPVWVTASPVSRSHKYGGKQGPPRWSEHWGPLSREGALSMICGFKECLICLEKQPPLPAPPASHPPLHPCPCHGVEAWKPGSPDLL